MIGTVKFFRPAPHFYGFIEIEGGMDFFFPGRQVLGELPLAGDEVSFWLSDDPRGDDRLMAVQVRRRERTIFEWQG